MRRIPTVRPTRIALVKPTKRYLGAPRREDQCNFRGSRCVTFSCEALTRFRWITRCDGDTRDPRWLC